MFAKRENRYWLYFGLALLASVGVFIFVVASILSAAPLAVAILTSYLSWLIGTSVTAEIIISSIIPIITALQQIICVTVAVVFALVISFFAAAVTAAIDYYFATIAKTVVSIPYYLACILYYAAYVFVIIAFISISLTIVLPILLFNFIAKQLSLHTTAVYRICFALAFLAILAVGIIVAVSTVLFTVVISEAALTAALLLGIMGLLLPFVGLSAYFIVSDNDHIYDNHIEPCVVTLLGEDKGAGNISNGVIVGAFDYCQNNLKSAVEYVCEVCDFRDYIDDGSESLALE